MAKTILKLDSTAIKDYLTCPELWRLRHIESLQKTGVPKPAADKGTIFHKLLEEFYTQLPAFRGLPMQLADKIYREIVTDEYKKSFPDVDLDYYKILPLRFISYSLNYARDFPVVVRNGKAATELGFTKILIDEPSFLCTIEGKIDLLMEGPDGRIFVDHKTQEKKSTLYEFKTQFKTYAWATGYRRGMANYIGLTKEQTKETFRRDLIYFEEGQLVEWERYLVNIAWSIYFQRHQKAVPRGSRNWNSCSGVYESHPCAYTMLCEWRNRGKEEMLKKQYYHIQPWSPWKIGELEENENGQT